MLDVARTKKLVDQCWADEIVPTLVEYIKIPNKSPSFDPDWAAHGYVDEAVAVFERWAWAKLPSLPGATLDVVRLPGRTPVILIEVPGEGEDTVLLYGHLDKQPEMVGWTEGLGPWIPRLEGDKLYGRGGADDGYAMLGAMSALVALRDQDVPHARCVILIEACAESGSYDLPYYIDHLAARLGNPSLVVCLDSGCGNYDQALAEHVVALHDRGHARRTRARRGRAFGRRLRRGAVEFPHCTTAGQRVIAVIAQVLADHHARPAPE